MKKLFYLVVFTAFLALNAHSNVRANFNYAIFYAPDKGSYIETYLSVSGSSVVFKKQKVKYQGKIRVEINFSQDGKSISSNVYNLLSPEILDTTRKPNFIDLQRYALKPGTYQAEIKIADVNNDKAEPTKGTLTVVIAELNDSLRFSDIELAESVIKSDQPSSITKSGYDITPYPLTHFPEKVDRLNFYIEAYNTAKQLGADSKFLFTYYIETAELKEVVTGFYTFVKQKSAEVVPLIGQFDITKLSTGSYNLVIEIRDNNNQLKAQKKLAITRTSPHVAIALDNLKTVDTSGTFISQVTNPDTLRDYIACLWPISTTSERDWQYNQMHGNNIKLMQQYIYAFWENRNPPNPALAWHVYREEVKKVNKIYACGGQPGYMSDRGRVYLQYGAPSAAQQVPSEPDSYPYEIWQYYKLKNPSTGQFQSNKKFVFYNPTLDGKCFKLLHSDARGEMRDDRWQIKLKQRNNQIMDYDQTTPQSSYGDGASDLFNSPR
ncbi:MAG TPA: GWxTD domain-containing protein [Bacteroidia bacterium]|nr:GWxTD domain-containing protein [Bacteroidia bacterium]